MTTDTGFNSLSHEKSLLVLCMGVRGEYNISIKTQRVRLLLDPNAIRNAQVLAQLRSKVKPVPLHHAGDKVERMYSSYSLLTSAIDGGE
jgi:hypothetical protein